MSTKVISTTGILIGIVLLALAVPYYSTTTNQIEEDPLVTNLRGPGFKARVSFAPATGWNETTFNDEGWVAAPFPFPTTKDARWQPGAVLNGGTLFYRLRIPISNELLASGREIGFSPIYVSHENFSIFVDSQLVFTGGTKRQLWPTAVVTIPRGAVRDGYALVAIQAAMDADHIGIAHRGGVYVGPRDEIDLISVHGERAMGTYYLLPLLAKGSVFIVFALFFLFNPQQIRIFAFLMFAFFSALESLFCGDFFARDLGFSTTVTLLFASKTLATCALGYFWLLWFDAKTLVKSYLAASGGLVLFIGSASWQFAAKGVSWLPLSLFSATDVPLLVITVGALFLGTYRWRSSLEQRAMTVAIGSYLALCLWEFGFHPFVGFDKRPFFDLLLFYFLAGILARAFGAQERQLSRARVAQAIAQTTQMVAHDVRRPFSMFKAINPILKANVRPEFAQQYEKISRSLMQASQSTDSMLKDIMEIGSQAKLAVRPIELGAILDAALTSVFAYRPPGGIAISGSFELAHQLLVDPGKVGRAVTNIIENAAQATMASCPPGARVMWLDSKEVEREGCCMALLTIGNSGPPIPERDRRSIFEAFYSHGKSGGTGLGLAIASEVVNQHHGSIGCEWVEGRGMAFHLTLPLAKEASTMGYRLPKSSDDLLDGSS